jgi:hypothetical protein
MTRRYWYQTPHGWRYVDHSAAVGVGELSTAEEAALAVLPGGLPILGLYEAYQGLTGKKGVPPEVVAAETRIAKQLANLPAQINAALPSCPPDVVSSLNDEMTSALAAYQSAKSTYDATAEGDRTIASVRDMAVAMGRVQAVAQKIIDNAACTTKPQITDWLCKDGSFSSDGTAKSCTKTWTDYLPYVAAGAGALIVAAIVIKTVSR